MISFNRRLRHTFFFVWSCLSFFEEAFVLCVARNETGAGRSLSITVNLRASYFSAFRSLRGLWLLHDTHTPSGLSYGLHTSRQSLRVREDKKEEKREEFFKSHPSEDFKLPLWGTSACFIATIQHCVDLLIFKGLLGLFYSTSQKKFWVKWKGISNAGMISQSLWW